MDDFKNVVINKMYKYEKLYWKLIDNNQYISFRKFLEKFIPEEFLFYYLNIFNNYKSNLPRSGTIIIDNTSSKVLLVKEKGCLNIWSYPKGKIEINESFLDCAIRETKEETNLDIRKYIDPKKVLNVHKKKSKLYHFKLYDKSNKYINSLNKKIINSEIKEIKWFYFKDINSNNRMFNSYIRNTINSIKIIYQK